MPEEVVKLHIYLAGPKFEDAQLTVSLSIFCFKIFFLGRFRKQRRDLRQRPQNLPFPVQRPGSKKHSRIQQRIAGTGPRR